MSKEEPSRLIFQSIIKLIKDLDRASVLNFLPDNAIKLPSYGDLGYKKADILCAVMASPEWLRPKFKTNLTEMFFIEELWTKLDKLLEASRFKALALIS